MTADPSNPINPLGKPPGKPLGKQAGTPSENQTVNLTGTPAENPDGNPAATTVRQALQTARATLKASPSLEPDIDASLEADLLLGHVLDKPRSWLFAWPEQTLEPQQLQVFEHLVEKRWSGYPISYLTGRREFWGLSFAVSEQTLIPRPETELLVETALELGGNSPAEVLELGTGSGAIAVALASERPQWRLTASDISAGALAVATHNSQLHGDRVRFIQSHWFDQLDKHAYQLILSNPPYLEANDPHLERGDLRFEPHAALAAGDDGLDDIRVIVEQAPAFLAQAGYLLLEHGFAQHQAVRKLFEKRGFSQVRSINDLAGLPRVTLGQWR